MRVILTGDWHCGHESGLTPVASWPASTESKRVWAFFEKNIKALKPIDLLVLNGDAIDGRGDRSGSVEQITTDRGKQVDMALEVIEMIAPKACLLTYGTAYHTGREEDWEQQLYHRVRSDLGIKAQIGAHETAAVGDSKNDKLILDVKHKIGGSQIPHGRFTAVARERLWNILWAEAGQRPKAHMLIRSHVHYYGYSGSANWVGMTLPALQGLGSRYGSRECSGMIHIGFVALDVKSSTDYAFRACLLPHDSAPAKVFSV